MRRAGRRVLSVVGCLVLMVGFTGTINETHAQQDPVSLDEVLGGVHVGGHVHTLATHLDQEFQNGTSADTGAVDVSSLELALTSSPAAAVDASVTLLMEEELDDGRAGQDFDVDQAYVVLAGNHRVLADQPKRDGFDVSPWYLKAGKFYIPFGTSMDYHTFDVISEPQTLALAETLESAFQVGYSSRAGVNLYAGAFSGDGADSEQGRPADEEINDFVVGVDYSFGPGSLSAQWTNNLNNSITLISEAGPTARGVGGLSLFADVHPGPVRLQVAHVAALDEYEAGPLTGGAAANPRPSATTVELTYGGLGRLGSGPVDGTLVYERTDEWLNHPEAVYGAVVDVSLFTGATGSVEYLQRAYDSNFSNRLSDEELVSFRVAVEFGDLLGADGR